MIRFVKILIVPGLAALVIETNEWVGIIEYSIGPHKFGIEFSSDFESVPSTNVLMTGVCVIM